MRNGGARAIKRLIAFALIVGAGAAGKSTPLAAAVFGRDDRSPLTSAHSELAQKIGALTSSKSGAICSAFCLAPDVIATAAHCVFGPTASDRPALADLKFQLTYPGAPAASGVADAAIAGQTEIVIAGSRRLSISPPISAARDWAVVRLAAPVCKAGGLPLAEAPDAAQAADIFHVAVHRDRADAPLLMSRDCALPAANDPPPRLARNLARDFSSWRDIRLHGCDTGGGSSGSPLLIERDGEAIVVALNVGTYVAARNVVSAADGAASPRAPIANTAISIAPLAAAFRALSARRARQDLVRGNPAGAPK